MHTPQSLALTIILMAVGAVLMGFGFYEGDTRMWIPGIAFVALPVVYWVYYLGKNNMLNDFGPNHYSTIEAPL